MKAAAVTMSVVLLLLASIFAFANLLSLLLRLPGSVSLPLAARVVGALLFSAGFAMAAWLFRYRRPADMISSTYATFTKLVKRVPVRERLGRSEPLVVVGPQKYTRNPLYLGLVMTALSWGLASDTTSVLLGALLLLWFWLVVIPFEERELRALFGEQYSRYADAVPMSVPFTKRKR